MKVPLLICGLILPYLLQTIANNKRGGRRGTAKRSSGRRNAQTMVARSNPNNSVPTLGVGGSIPLGFPDKIVGKLRYHQSETLNYNGVTVTPYVFRWNSTFDPDYTGSGHQPMYRDTFASIYDSYSVISATARIKFINISPVAMYVGVNTDDDTSVLTTLDAMCEQTHGQHVLLPPMTGALSTHTFSASWSAKKFLGIDPFTSDAYKTAVGNNPDKNSYLIVWVQPQDSSDNSVIVDVEITYNILWSELTTPTSS